MYSVLDEQDEIDDQLHLDDNEVMEEIDETDEHELHAETDEMHGDDNID